MLCRNEGDLQVRQNVVQNAQSERRLDPRGETVVLAEEVNHGQHLIQIIGEGHRRVKAPVFFERGEKERENARNAQKRLDSRIGRDHVWNADAIVVGGTSQGGLGKRLVKHAVDVIDTAFEGRNETSKDRPTPLVVLHKGTTTARRPFQRRETLLWGESEWEAKKESFPGIGE